MQKNIVCFDKLTSFTLDPMGLNKKNSNNPAGRVHLLENQKEVHILDNNLARLSCVNCHSASKGLVSKSPIIESYDHDKATRKLLSGHHSLLTEIQPVVRLII